MGIGARPSGAIRTGKEAFNEVVKENPRHARALYALGEALLNEGEEGDARGYFEQTLEVDTTYAQAHVQIARMDLRSNDLAAAAHRLSRTILIEPGIAESFRLLGQIYLRQGRESAGEKSLEAYEKVKSFEKEIDYFQERLRADPDDGEAHYNLGFIYGRLGFTGSGSAALRPAVTINPGHIQALNNMGNIYFRTGYLDQAAAAYEQIMSAR